MTRYPYLLFDADNTLLESSAEPIVYLHGGFSGMPPKLEESLSNHKAGEAVSVTDVALQYGFIHMGRFVRLRT